MITVYAKTKYATQTIDDLNHPVAVCIFIGALIGLLLCCVNIFTGGLWGNDKKVIINLLMIVALVFVCVFSFMAIVS